MLSRRTYAHECGLAGHAVTDKDIVITVGIPGDQVVGIRRKRHVAPIGANPAVIAVTVSLPHRTDADARGLAGHAVTDKGIGLAIRVVGDQIVGIEVKAT